MFRTLALASMETTGNPMAIFAIITQPNVEYDSLNADVMAAYPGSFVLDGKAGWLVSAATSARNLAESLKVSLNGVNGPSIVFEVNSYWGRANPNTWTWLKEKMEAGTNA